MNCREIQEQLSLYVDGELEREHLNAFRKHLEDCAVCTQAFKDAQAFSDVLGGEIQRYCASIRPPDGARELLLAQCKSQVRRRNLFRPLITVAAAVAVILSIAVWRRSEDSGIAMERTQLLQRYSELDALKNWQDELALTVERKPDDRSLALVACAYLPKERGQELLKKSYGLDLQEGSLAAAWPETSTLVVRLERSSRSHGRSTEMKFEQWSDGRVHVEHTEHNGADEVVTKLDAGTWEILAAQNPALCRELEIVDAEGRLIAGLPLPSAGTLRRDTVAALTQGAKTNDLMKRLLSLRLATRVTSKAEMEHALQISALSPVKRSQPTPMNVSVDQLRMEVRQLESATGSSGASVMDVNAPQTYFRKLCEL